MKIKLIMITIVLALSSKSVMAQVPSYVATNGLVGYWPFNGNANDESGNGNNGTNNGATLTSDRFGNSNSAFYFSSSACNTRIDANINTSSIQSGLTISLWINKSGDGCLSPRVFEFYSGSGGPTDAFMIWPNNGNTSFGSITSTNTFVSSSFTPEPNGIWFNLIYTNDGSNGRFYKNGILFQTIPSSGMVTLNGNLAIGRMNHPAFDAFNGKIDDFGIWNRALTQEEIVGLYNAQAAGCETLVINSGPLSFNPPVYQSTVTIYPNPANDQITIDCGNLANVAGWSIKIVNAIGQEVFTGAMNTPQYVVPLNSWSGQGLYFVKIYDASNNLVNTKKIILQ